MPAALPARGNSDGLAELIGAGIRIAVEHPGAVFIDERVLKAGPCLPPPLSCEADTCFAPAAPAQFT